METNMSRLRTLWLVLVTVFLTLALVAIVALLVFARAEPEGHKPTTGAAKCIRAVTDIAVSTGSSIPSRDIVEVRGFLMVSKRSTSTTGTCDTVRAFLDEVRAQGGNAVIEFRISYEPSGTPNPYRTTVVHGTAVVAGIAGTGFWHGRSSGTGGFPVGPAVPAGAPPPRGAAGTR